MTLMTRHAPLFLAELRHRWVECLLGTAVVAVVTATLIFQRSLTESADARLHDLAHRLGKNMLVAPADSNPVDIHMLRYDDSSMPDDYPERLARSPLSQHIRLAQAQLRANVEIRGVPVILVGEGDTRPNDPMAATVARAELGQEAAQRLGARLGDELLIAGTPVLVTGVRGSPPDGLGMGVFTSLAAAQRILNRPGQINSMRLGGCWCKLDVPTLGKDVERLLPGTRAITVAGVLKAQKGTVDVMERYATALFAVGLLLVAATVFALTSSQVRRSLRESGLLLAVGASAATVQGMVIVKAAVVGAAGGLLGYFAAFPLMTRLGSRLLQLPLEPSAGLLGPAVALCALASVAAAALPARRAARLDPCEILRED